MAQAQATPTAGARASRPQPQTGGGGGPTFEQASFRAQRPAYLSSGNAYGNVLDNPLASAPGYLASLDLYFNATGGVNATTNTVTGATNGTANDFGVGSSMTGARLQNGSGAGTSPAALVQYVSLQDAYGTQLFAGPGYEMLHLVPKYSGQVGVLAAGDLNHWPSFSASGLSTGTSTATTVTGNFQFPTRIPLEIVPAYGCIAIGNSSLQPKLHIQMNASATLYSTAPSTLPTIAITVDEPYWGVPIEDQNIIPDGLGTTLQWQFVVCQPAPGAGAVMRALVPRMGGVLTTLIFVARDGNGLRDDRVWPAFGANNRIKLYVDGQPVLDESIEHRVDKMFESFAGALGGNGTTPPTGGYPLREAGVIAYSFKTSESQANLGFLDNLNQARATTPGTQVEIECSPWGTGFTAPAQLACIVGQIVPKGNLVRGAVVLG